MTVAASSEGHARGAVVFGGAGFIGRHLVAELRRRRYAPIVVADVSRPRWQLSDDIEFRHCDVRRPIPSDLAGRGPLAINLAAIHRTPGHADHEYFETNERGAETVTAYCREVGAERLWFTSSIAVYGPSEDAKTEATEPAPESAYGRSKAAAEAIHRQWTQEDARRRLVIVRPATVFGSGEGGNFTRLARALRQRRFVYPARRDTLKSCGFVGDLTASLFFMDSQASPVALYNFAYPRPPTIEEICERMSAVAGYPRPKVTLPLSWMLVAAKVLKAARVAAYDPARVMKLVRSTNVLSHELERAGFPYKTDLELALREWYAAEPAGQFV